MTENKDFTRNELQRRLFSKIHRTQALDDTSIDDVYLAHDLLKEHQTEREIQNRESLDIQPELESALYKYADIYDSSPIGYLGLDNKGNIRDCNLTTAEILSQTRSQLLNIPFRVFLDKDSRGEFISVLLNTLKTGEESSVDLRLKSSSRFPRFIHMHIATSGDIGNLIAARATLCEVSEKKLAEMVLRESEARYRSLVDLSPNAVVVHDLKGRILFVNHATVRLVEAESEKQLHGVSVLDFIHPDCREKTLQLMRSLIQDKRPVQLIEQKLVTLAGNEISVEISGGLMDFNGKPAIQVVALDITSRKRAAEKALELLQQNRTLTKRMFQLQEDERQRLARELHDEFGQWLTAIQLDAQNIANVLGNKSPKIQTSLASIIYSAQQIHDNLRRINRSLRPALLDELGLTSSLHELLSQWQKHTPYMRCRMDISDRVSGVENEKDLSITIFRIVQEALTNVSKHAQATRVELLLQLIKSEETSRDALLLIIEDNGIGMCENAQGTGLGLIGMRERVKALGGKFRIENKYSEKLNSDQIIGLKIVAEFPINDDVSIY